MILGQGALILACNYNINATEDDGSCTELDECGVCGGEAFQKEIVIAMEINSMPLARAEEVALDINNNGFAMIKKCLVVLMFCRELQP